jgi:hypothetical protein
MVWSGFVSTCNEIKISTINAIGDECAKWFEQQITLVESELKLNYDAYSHIAVKHNIISILK